MLGLVAVWWAWVCYDCLTHTFTTTRVVPSTVSRIMADEGLLLHVDYHKQRRELAKQRKAAFAAPPTGPNQVWELDFSEYETTGGGTWRVAGVADYFSRHEFGWHWSPTANQHDAIAGVELALAEAEAMLGGVSLVGHLTVSTTGETYAGNDGRKLSSPEEPVRGDHCGGLGRDPSAAPC